MKKKIIEFLIFILLITIAFIPVSNAVNIEKKVTQNMTLITDSGNNRIIVVDNVSNIVWQYSNGLHWPIDVERLSTSNILITDYGNNRVIEIDIFGNIVWQYLGEVLEPTDAERLENGNTLITDSGNNRIIEVDNNSNVIWQYTTELNKPTDAERLENGNTLISDTYNYRVIEVNTAGNIEWQFFDYIIQPNDAERLINGNTLITDEFHWIFEVDNAGNIVWNKSTGLYFPTDSERLINGNTMIADNFNHRVIEVDNTGHKVWEKTELNYPWDAERFSNQTPNTPEIEGPRIVPPGNYNFTFLADDLDSMVIWYFIEWGDGTNTGWIGPFNSGIAVTASHTWFKRGIYTIRCRAKDPYDADSEWSDLTIEIPRTRASSHLLYEWLLERFPILERLLGFIL